jgi:DNA-binding PadR family transcriptional regulator
LGTKELRKIYKLSERGKNIILKWKVSQSFNFSKRLKYLMSLGDIRVS